MKVVLKNVEMVASFDAAGEVRPIKFRFTQEDASQVIKVDRILCKERQKIAGTPMLLFSCQSVIQGNTIQYQLKYDVNKNTWLLYKI